MDIGLIDFDDIDSWWPDLASVLYPLLPISIGPAMVALAPNDVESARDYILSMSHRDKVIDASLDWVCSKSISGYHGARLTDSEITSIQKNGLIPLWAEARRNRLESALSEHPKWSEERLNMVIQDIGQGQRDGKREGQVHLTLSRSGLINGFNHYLFCGSEFDQKVAYALLGDEGTALLSNYGKPTVIRVAVPGELALKAAHPHFSTEEMRIKGEIPNLLREILSVWSYRLANEGFQSRTLKADCGMVFSSNVPSNWIVAIDRVMG